MRGIELLLPAVACLSLGCEDTRLARDEPPSSNRTPREAGAAGARGESRRNDPHCSSASDLDFVVEPTDPARISETMTYMLRVRVHGDRLYYNGKQSLYSLPLSGGRASEIYSDTSKPPLQNFFVRENDYLVIHGEYHGQSRTSSISRVPLDGTPPHEVRELIDTTDVWSLIYQDDMLYASHPPGTLYSLNLNTGERTDFGSITVDKDPEFFVDGDTMLISDLRNNDEPVKLFSVLLSENSVSDYMLSPMPTKLSALGATGGYFYYSASTDPGPGPQIRRAPLTGGASEMVADVPETVWGGLAESEAGLAFVSSTPPVRLFWQPKNAASPRELTCMGNEIVAVENFVLHGNVLYAVVGLSSGPTIRPDSWGIIRRPLE